MHKTYMVYILQCHDKSYYIGVTNDIERRLLEHQFPENTGSYTSKRLPVTLVYTDEFSDINQAIDREKQIKKWSRKKKEALIEANHEKLVYFSKAYRDTFTAQVPDTTLREPQGDNSLED